MKIFAYTRFEPNEQMADVWKEMIGRINERFDEPSERAVNTTTQFRHDGQGGKLGLTHTLRKIRSGDLLVFRFLSDAARDLQGCVKQLASLAEHDIAIFVTSTRLFLAAGKEQTDTRVVFALLQAHQQYVRDNRSLGVAAAKLAGAQIGRPKLYELDDVRDIIEEMSATLSRNGSRKAQTNLTNANKGHLPSIRQLAKRLECGTTKAMELLHEYKAEQGARG